MVSRMATSLVAAFLAVQVMMVPAYAENQMNYSLLPASEAGQLSRGGGVLGMDVGRAQEITDGGMTFELMKVNSVRRGSPAEKAGLKVSDQVIAVDGRVFPSVAAFAAYVGSKQPATPLSIDYMPAGSGPQQAQRVSVILGGAPRAGTTQQTPAPASTGLSTGTKIAIGVGAAALFGCYKFGCFSHKTTSGTVQQPAGAQQ